MSVFCVIRVFFFWCVIRNEVIDCDELNHFFFDVKVENNRNVDHFLVFNFGVFISNIHPFFFLSLFFFSLSLAVFVFEEVFQSGFVFVDEKHRLSTQPRRKPHVSNSSVGANGRIETFGTFHNFFLKLLQCFFGCGKGKESEIRFSITNLLHEKTTKLKNL